jgi:translation initiation factor eIF-2B subunit epsilon
MVVKGNLPIDHASLEIKSVKLKTNVKQNSTTTTYQDVIGVILVALLKYLEPNQAFITEFLSKWSSVITEFMVDKDDQFYILKCLSNECESNSKLSQVFSIITFQLYENDVLEEDLILKWYYSNSSRDIVKQMVKFVEWLENASEEDEDDDEEEEEEEDE